MLRKATPEVAIAFVKLSLALSLYCPLSSTATKAQLLRYNILRCLNFINAWLLLVPLLMTLQDFSTRPDICLKSSPLIFGLIQGMIQAKLCQCQYRNFQLVIEEMENFCKHANIHEKKILQNYVDKYVVFYTAIISCFYLTALGVICSPQLLNEPFPTHAKYPFDAERQPLRTLIYVQQSYSGIQMASQLNINILIALLLWFVGARFEILSKELRMISNINELIQSIRKHQRILRYAIEVTDVVRYSVLITVIFAGNALLFTSLTFVSREPIVVKIQFLVLSFVAIFQVFICCWPANNLQLMSSEISQAVFESPWYTYNFRVQKNFCFILLRCQKPITVSVSCFIPNLSLKYFSSFMSTAFSYFTTLRVMIVDANDDDI